MAEIDVRPKRKSKFWLWILLIFIVSVLLFFLLNKDNTATSDKVIQDTVNNLN